MATYGGYLLSQLHQIIVCLSKASRQSYRTDGRVHTQWKLNGTLYNNIHVGYKNPYFLGAKILPTLSSKCTTHTVMFLVPSILRHDLVYDLKQTSSA